MSTDAPNVTPKATADAEEALRQLYHGLILSHSARPRHYGPLADAHWQATLDNPLCGDTVTIYLRIADGSHPGQPAGSIEAAHFTGDGCAIARASASILTSLVEGKSAAEARALAEALQRFLASRSPAPADDKDAAADGGPAAAPDLGDLVALAGLRSVPSRRRCGTLPWEALVAALNAAHAASAPASPV
jgi:nitrogen fixation NifU-like protein